MSIDARKRRAAQPYLAPTTPLEEKLSAIWSEFLQVDRIGMADEFAGLGGTSLLAMLIVSRARHALGLEIPLQALSDRATIRELAQSIEHPQPKSDATRAGEG